MSSFLDICIKYNVVELSDFEREILEESGADTAFTFANAEEIEFLQDTLEFVKNEWETFKYKPSQLPENFIFSFVTVRRFKLLIKYAKSHDLQYFYDLMHPESTQPCQSRRSRVSSSSSGLPSSSSSSPSSPRPSNPQDLEPFRTDFLRKLHVLYENLIPANTDIEVVVGETADLKLYCKVTCPVEGCPQTIAPYFAYHQGRFQIIPSSVNRHIARHHKQRAN